MPFESASFESLGLASFEIRTLALFQESNTHSNSRVHLPSEMLRIAEPAL